MNRLQKIGSAVACLGAVVGFVFYKGFADSDGADHDWYGQALKVAVGVAAFGMLMFAVGQGDNTKPTN